MASLYITAAIDVHYFQKINIRYVSMRNSVVNLENIRSYIHLILLTKKQKKLLTKCSNYFCTAQTIEN